MRFYVPPTAYWLYGDELERCSLMGGGGRLFSDPLGNRALVPGTGRIHATPARSPPYSVLLNDYWGMFDDMPRLYADDLLFIVFVVIVLPMVTTLLMHMVTGYGQGQIPNSRPFGHEMDALTTTQRPHRRFSHPMIPGKAYPIHYLAVATVSPTVLV